MTLTLSHFSAVLLFATFASVVFGITQKTTTRDMVRYGVLCWVGLVALVVVASWAMFFVRG